jgi:hypothetical protein
MTTTWRVGLWVLSLLLLPASAGFAQSDLSASSGPPPAHLSVIEGQAHVDREGRADPAVANLPLLDGDRLRTEDGRLEVILSDGSLLHVDRATTVDLLAPDLLRLLRGRVYVIVRGARDPQRAIRYQVDAPVASVQTGGPGEFRVWSAESSRGREVELAVFSGQAILASDGGAEEIRAGERSIVRDGLAPSAPQYFNSARWDEFGRWSAARRDDRLGTASVQYLPSELAVYASTFDRYGTWRSDPDEGAVWYPSVEAGWRPYSVGHWRTYPAWGSFWIGGDPWGWPTHHYGHWGFSFSFGWYWRPATLWGPAWVSWAFAPGFVSWCPLGRHGFPVFGHFGVRGRHVGSHVDPWRGWTVVPRNHFGQPTPVHRVAIDGHRLGPSVRGSFAAGRPISGPNRAVPRANAGALAVPRSPSRSGADAPRGSLGTAVPRGAGTDGSAGRRAWAVPRGTGGAALPDSRERRSPDEAARVFAGSGTGASGTAARRALPSAPATGSATRRTDASPATPDVAAFGLRRNSTPAAPRATPRPNAPAQFGNGAPAQFGSGAPARFGNGDAAAFGSGARSRAYPRSNSSPSPTGTSAGSTPPAPRQRPYAGSSGAVERRAAPRASGAPAQAAPRGGGIPAGPGARSGGAGSSSAPSAAPRYNPGSGASRPPSGGSSSPPPRRRGGAPD